MAMACVTHLNARRMLSRFVVIRAVANLGSHVYILSLPIALQAGFLVYVLLVITGKNIDLVGFIDFQFDVLSEEQPGRTLNALSTTREFQGVERQSRGRFCFIWHVQCVDERRCLSPSKADIENKSSPRQLDVTHWWA